MIGLVLLTLFLLSCLVLYELIDQTLRRHDEVRVSRLSPDGRYIARIVVTHDFTYQNERIIIQPDNVVTQLEGMLERHTGLVAVESATELASVNTVGLKGIRWMSPSHLRVEYLRGADFINRVSSWRDVRITFKPR